MNAVRLTCLLGKRFGVGLSVRLGERFGVNLALLGTFPYRRLPGPSFIKQKRNLRHCVALNY